MVNINILLSMYHYRVHLLFLSRILDAKIVTVCLSSADRSLCVLGLTPFKCLYTPVMYFNWLLQLFEIVSLVITDLLLT